MVGMEKPAAAMDAVPTSAKTAVPTSQALQYITGSTPNTLAGLLRPQLALLPQALSWRSLCSWLVSQDRHGYLSCSCQVFCLVVWGVRAAFQQLPVPKLEEAWVAGLRSSGRYFASSFALLRGWLRYFFVVLCLCLLLEAPGLQLLKHEFEPFVLAP